MQITAARYKDPPIKHTACNWEDDIAVYSVTIIFYLMRNKEVVVTTEFAPELAFAKWRKVIISSIGSLNIITAVFFTEATSSLHFPFQLQITMFDSLLTPTWIQNPSTSWSHKTLHFPQRLM